MIELNNPMIPIFISVISLAVALGALFINWRKFIRERPRMSANVTFARYFRDASEKPNQILVRLLIQFKNKGQAPGSVTDLVASIRYQENLFKSYPYLKYKFDKFMFSDRPLNYLEDCPLTIQSNGAESKSFDFLFEDIVFEYIDRCQIAIDLRNPKKREWVDLPILVRIIADTSSGKVEFICCVFEKDQEESKQSMGTIDHLYGGTTDEFAPKIDFE